MTTLPTQTKTITDKRCVSGICHLAYKDCEMYFSIQYLWHTGKWTQTTDTQAIVYCGSNGTQ